MFFYCFRSTNIQHQKAFVKSFKSSALIKKLLSSYLIISQYITWSPLILHILHGIPSDRMVKKLPCTITVKISKRIQKRNKYDRFIWKLVQEGIHLSCDFFHSIRFKVNKGWSKALLLFLYLIIMWSYYLGIFLK